MNFSLIHSLTYAKYSVIKVADILCDLTSRYLHASRITHPLVIGKKKKKIWVFFLLKDRKLSFTKSPSQNVLGHLRNTSTHHSNQSPPGGGQQVCTL